MKKTKHSTTVVKSARPTLDLKTANVVGIATTFTDLDFVLDLQSGDRKRPQIDAVELRLDSNDFCGQPKAVATFLSHNRIPAILTPRHFHEGGCNIMYPNVREKMLLRLMKFPCVWGIDVEIKCRDELKKSCERAHQLDVKVVGSFHDLSGTPDFHEIEKIVTSAFANMKADVCKIATMAHTLNDIHALAKVLEWETAQEMGFGIARRPIAVMSIGRLNKATRPIFAQLGSVLNYGYTGKPMCKGQWPAGALRKVIRCLLTEDFVQPAAKKT